jgi:site-specific DNA-cytosine methylase
MRLKKKFTQLNGKEKALCLMAKSYENWTGDYIEEEYLKTDRKGNIKKDQNKAGSLSVGDNCCGNHSDMDCLIIPEATKKGYTEIENGECFDMLHPNSKTRRGRKMKDKSNCLTIVQPEFYRYQNTRIRRLTPLECCRLQTIPEAETEKILSSGVSDSQIYKMLGNGWTVDVIAYILKHL